MAKDKGGKDKVGGMKMVMKFVEGATPLVLRITS